MASILESFVIAFQSDTNQLDKSLSDVSTKLDKTEKELNKAEVASTKLGGSLLKMGVQVAGVVTALFSMGAVMGGISSAVSYADQIGEAADALGVTTENLSAWSDAAKKIGR